MSLSDSKQTSTHGHVGWLPPLQVLIWLVHPPLWPTLGCGFVQEISTADPCRMLAGPGMDGDTGGHPAVTALCSVLMAQNSSRALAVSSQERKGVHTVYRKPQSPQHEHEPSQHGLVPWSQSEALGPALGWSALS